jgi:hypothetical protein
VKQKLTLVLGCVYLIAGTYYAAALAYALRNAGAPSRDSITLLVAAVWIAVGGLGLAMGRRWGWWTLMVFFLVTSGAHLNRLFAQRPTAAGPGSLAPLLWNAVHIAILVWLRHHSVRRDAVLDVPAAC